MIEYLNHKFLPTEGGGIHNCKICNLRVYIRLSMYQTYIEYCWYLSNKWSNNWINLELTCNEQVIKNLLE